MAIKIEMKDQMRHGAEQLAGEARCLQQLNAHGPKEPILEYYAYGEMPEYRYLVGASQMEISG